MSTWMCKIAWFSLREFSEQLHAFVWFALPAHQCKRRFHMKPAFRSTILAIFIFCCDRVCSLVVSRKWIKHVTHRFRCSALLRFYFLHICTWERYSECFTRRQGDVTWHKKKHVSRNSLTKRFNINSPEYPNILGHPWRHETHVSTNENARFGWSVGFHNKPRDSRWRTNRVADAFECHECGSSGGIHLPRIGLNTVATMK